MTKHIIFDLDGTLIDSMPVWRNTGKRYLESHNIPIPPNLLSVMKKQTLPQTAEFSVRNWGQHRLYGKFVTKLFLTLRISMQIPFH